MSNKMKVIQSVVLVLLLLVSQHITGQAPLKKLPPNINRASIDLWAPSVSGYGYTIIFLSNYTDDGYHRMRWSTKKTLSTWNDVMQVNKLIDQPTLNFKGGYSLNFDGTELYFTSLKSGIGGFDIWHSRRRGNDWEAPRNLGKPVNSSEHDGCASVSPDGKYLYFMRCETMKTHEGATGCRLMVSERNFRGWGEPIELPDNINTGNSQTPRILADGESLIFSSDKMGGMGGLDLFITRKSGENTYTDPVAMEFANTPGDDSFVSVDAKGRYLYKDRKGERDNELVQILIPEELQPKQVMQITGKVQDEGGAPINAQLTVFDINERKRLWNEEIGKKGEFKIVLNEGSAYYVTIDNQEPNFMYFAKTLDLEEIGNRDRKNFAVELKPISAAEEYPLDINFEEHGSKLKDISTYELRQLAGFLRKNETLNFSLEIHQTQYREDSIFSDMDLTEERMDTIFYDTPKVSGQLVDTRYDSLLTQIDLTSESNQSVQIDSINYHVIITDDSLKIETLTPVSLSSPDSLVSDSTAVIDPPAKMKRETDSFVLKKFHLTKIYHNDRTQKQGIALTEALTELGVDKERIDIQTKISELKPESLDEENDVSDSSIKVTLKIKSI